MTIIEAKGKYLTTELDRYHSKFVWTTDKSKAMPFRDTAEAYKLLADLSVSHADLMSSASGVKVTDST